MAISVDNSAITTALLELRPKWTLEIIHQAFTGVKKFEQFRANLGVARNLLSDRLQHLQHIDILERKPVGSFSKRHEYQLTEKGMTLLPVLIALHQWGEQWFGDGGIEIIDMKTLSVIEPMLPLNTRGRVVDYRHVRIIERPK